MQISEKKLSTILKSHPFEKTNPANENPQVVEKSSTKKRKTLDTAEQPEKTGTKRLKKLKDVSNDDQDQEKITINLPKGKKGSPQKKTVSYEEQAANFASTNAVTDKLDAFRFTSEHGSKKADLDAKFKFVDDNEGPKKNKTLDDWKIKADSKPTTTKAEVKPKNSEPQEKQTQIDPKAYFAMFGGSGSKAKKAPPAETKLPPSPKPDAIEIEQEGEEVKEIPPVKEVPEQIVSSVAENENEIEKNKEEEDSQIQNTLTTQETFTQQNTQKQFSQNENKKPFAGLSFGVVGEMNSATKNQVVEILEGLGAEITDDIDEYVWGLVVGSCLEDGRDIESSVEYDAAIKADVKIYTEIEFDKYLRTETGRGIEDFLAPSQKMPEITPNKVTPRIEQPSPIFTASPALTLPMSVSKPAQTIQKQNQMQIEDNTPVNKYKPIQPQQPLEYAKKSSTTVEKLWTDKHAPTNIADIVGNQDIVRNLMMWLKDWDNVHIQGNKKNAKFDSKKGKDAWAQNNLNAKGCLVSGPPGIGKTSSVRIIAKTMGYEVIEQNASDVRNKLAVEGLLNHLTDNTLVNFSKNKISMNKKFLILMDEVDGMSSGDRGGNQVLINAIKNTKAPIICVCNDRQHQKVRSLATHCYDLRFQKPPKRNVAQRLQQIAKKENLNIELDALEYLCESFGNDIRQTVNYLQLHAKRSNTLTFSEAKESLAKVSKDRTVMMNNFEAAKLLLSGTNELPVRDKIDLFFIDYDMIPLIVHENYLPNSSYATHGELEWIAKAADYLADGDVLGNSVKKGEWGLLPNYAFVGSVFPCDIMQTQVQWPKFPEWLGKNSSQRKKTREIREIRATTAPEALANFSDILFDCAQSFLDLINYNLQNNDKASVELVVDIMEYYNLTPEIIKEHLVDIQVCSKSDPFAGVSTQTKSLLTRTYNAKHKSSVKAGKSKKNIGGGDAEGGKRYNEEADDDDMGEPEENLEDSVEEDEVKPEVETSKAVSAQKSTAKKSKKQK